MNKFRDFSNDLIKILDEKDIKIDEPMSSHTSFKVGGPADILITPESADQVLDAVKLCKSKNVPLLHNGKWF